MRSVVVLYVLVEADRAVHDAINEVGGKSEDGAGVGLAVRARDLLIRQRTMLANMLHAHFAEFGTVTAKAIGEITEPSATAR